MKAVIPVLYKRNISDKVGIIKIRITQNRKQTYISLKERLPVQYWNENTNRVRENKDVPYEALNAKIEDVLSRYSESQKVFNVDNSLSFITYYERVINRISNEGSRIKHETVKNKLEAYLKSINKPDLEFAEITEDLIFDLRKFFLKKLSNNTANHYLKMVKGVVNKAVKENVFNYIRNPFSSIEFNNTKSQSIKSLSESEVTKLLNVTIQDQRLNKYKQFFLFQMFCQGMRVSDLQLLRWNNIEGNYIQYSMHKTKQQMNIFLNDNLLSILAPYAKQLLIRVGKAKTLETLEHEVKEAEAAYHTRLKFVYEVQTGFDLWPFENLESDKCRQLYNDLKLSKESLKLYYANVIKNQLSTDKQLKNRFIFDFLSNEDFENIDFRNDFSKISTQQYRKLKNNSIVYNRNLKTIQELAKIKTILTTHTARHTYASLLINSDNVNLYDISKSLGHSDISITEKYISKFNSDKLDSLNSGIATKFKIVSR